MMEITGSSFPKGIPNNTNIETVYAELKAERSKNHKQNLTDFFAMAKEQKEQAVAEHEADKQAKEDAEQERLKQQFPPEDFDGLEDETVDETEIENQASEDVNPILGNFSFGEDEEEVVDEDDFESMMSEDEDMEVMANA